MSDWLKFGACLLIATHHYSQYAIGIPNLYNKIYYALALQGGYIGVALFFFLSGYGLMVSEKKKHLEIIPFIKRRLLKIYLPTLCASVLWLPFYHFMDPQVKLSKLIFKAIGGGVFIYFS